MSVRADPRGRAPAAAPISWRGVLGQAASALSDEMAARWLLEEASGRSFGELVGHLDELVPDNVASALDRLVARRLAGEPLQHVIGHWPFAGVELVVDGRALVPRPETELLVELARRELAPIDSPLVLDLGTGSGAIACALVNGREDLTAVAVDTSCDALALAALNRDRLPSPSRLVLRHSNWYEAVADELAGRVDLVVSNPPYLAESEWPGLDPVVREHDPRPALVAGESGLEGIEAVFAGAPIVLRQRGVALVEIGEGQGTAAAALAKVAGARQTTVIDDLAGRPRIVRAQF